MNRHMYKEGSKNLSPAENIKGGECIVCGTKFDGWHLRSKTTCSAKCRKTLSRWKQRQDASLQRAINIIEFYCDTMKDEDLKPKAINALKVIREIIDDALDSA